MLTLLNKSEHTEQPLLDSLRLLVGHRHPHTRLYRVMIDLDARTGNRNLVTAPEGVE